MAVDLYLDVQKKNQDNLMNDRIFSLYTELRRKGLTWDERWKGKYKGLIMCRDSLQFTTS